MLFQARDSLQTGIINQLIDKKSKGKGAVMRLVIQRVKEASVTIEGEVKGKIDTGLLVFLGVGAEDNQLIAKQYADKLLKLRIFEDENGKTNLSLNQVGGKLLIISQFTLYADCSHGNRPSFTAAAAPQLANELYEYFVQYCRDAGFVVETGEFGADMKVSLLNDGPFTILLDESILR